MIISTLLLMGLIIVLFVFIPLICKIVGQNAKWIKILEKVLFCGYLLMALALTLSRVGFGNYVTLEFVLDGSSCAKRIWWFDNFNWRDAVINLMMLAPIGVIVYDDRRNFGKNILVGLIIGWGIGVIIETLQFVLPIRRTVQVQDAVFNGISVALGILGTWVVMRIAGIMRKNKGEKNGED